MFQHTIKNELDSLFLMVQECPAWNSSYDRGMQNVITHSQGSCNLCTERFIREFGSWTAGMSKSMRLCESQETKHVYDGELSAVIFCENKNSKIKKLRWMLIIWIGYIMTILGVKLIWKNIWYTILLHWIDEKCWHIGPLQRLSVNPIFSKLEIIQLYF